jgi:hypothetical protein
VKLCSKTQARAIYSTCRTATERENLGIWARDSLTTRKGCSKARGTQKAWCALWFVRVGRRERRYAINPVVYSVLLESNYG